MLYKASGNTLSLVFGCCWLFGFPSTITTKDLFKGKKFPLYSQVLSRNLGGFSLDSHIGTPLTLRMDRTNEDLR